jgi:hypothetical protein
VVSALDASRTVMVQAIEPTLRRSGFAAVQLMLDSFDGVP